jgi:3-oxoacyl-(acyl-carrier-protein) synthase
MNRVVVTGIGVLAPNGHGAAEFEQALRQGRSGITSRPERAALGFGCTVGGIPQAVDLLRDRYFDSTQLMGMDRHAVMGCIAGLDCWEDAGFSREACDTVDWDSALSFGSGIGSVETIGKLLVPFTDEGRVRRLGSSIPERIMTSSVCARLSGFLGIGGQIASVSSACATGVEAILNGYRMVREGSAQRVLAGSCESDSLYLAASFDAMRVLSRSFNDAPEHASRPMSASASGFVPAAGAAAVMLETLQSATARGARIYAEIAGGAANCGGQRNGGSMTAGNPEGARRCIRQAVCSAGVLPEDIDLISGHLTATRADATEIGNWLSALELPRERFPLVNAPKSLFGHALGAAGAIECVAVILQLWSNFVHPSLNCEDLHPELAWCERSIPRECLQRESHVAAKACFGFGDVNTCILFRKFNHQ